MSNSGLQISLYVEDFDGSTTHRTPPHRTPKDSIAGSSTTTKRKFHGRKNLPILRGGGIPRPAVGLEGGGIPPAIWDKIFAISCVFGVAFDPLFFYVVITNEDMKCLRFDRNLRTTALVLRSFTDVFYAVELILNLKGVMIRNVEAVMIQYRGETHFSPRRIILLAIRILKSRLLISFFALLPVPQLIMIVLFPRTRGSISIYGNVLILLQYAVRILRIYQARTVFRSMVSSICLNGLLKFCMFIIASHVIGALCYFFSFQRELRCWEDKCPSRNRCTFGCDDDPTVRNITVLNQLCPINPPNATLFDFGIFLDSLQSGMLESTDSLQKISYYSWWGLRNLSSFGSNLQTSSYAWENLFAAFVSITGMLLFLIYLNELMQRYMQIAASKIEENRRLTEMRRRREPQIASWLYESGLSMSWKEEIMTHAEKELGPDEEVNLQNIVSIVPLECCRYIKRNLCVATIKKVPGLETMDEKQLAVLCDNYLKPVIYTENSYIFKENEPVDKMVFITQGTVQTYTTSNFSRSTGLKRGDFCGEELLNWAEFHSRSQTESVKWSPKEDHEANSTLMANDSKGTLVSENERSHSIEMAIADFGFSNEVGLPISTQSVNLSTEEDKTLNLKDKKMNGIASNKVGPSISTQSVNLSTKDDEASHLKDKKMKGIAYEESHSMKMDRSDSGPSKKVGLSISTQNVNLSTQDDDSSNLEEGVSYDSWPSISESMVSGEFDIPTYADDLPISTRSVKCSTKVEAFILMPNDLKAALSEQSHKKI